MSQVDETVLGRLFKDARSQNGWLATTISDAALHAAYDIAKWGPTSMNTQPMRLMFIHSDADKQRLRPSLSPGNVEKVMTAPVIALICYDAKFYLQMSKVFPHRPEASKLYEGSPELTEATAFRNGTLQAAYFMLALRAVGLDTGPMSGFDAAKVQIEFLTGTDWRINMICGIGKGDSTKVFPRLPRLEFDDVVAASSPTHVAD